LELEDVSAGRDYNLGFGIHLFVMGNYYLVYNVEVSRLERRIVPLERFAHCFAAQLSGPQFFSWP
jgi:hypothetical protein